MSTTISEREQEQRQDDVYKSLRFLPFMVLGVLLNAYLLLLSWHWFIVPLGVREISFWHSAGFSTVISYLCSSWKNSQNDEARGYHYWMKKVQTGYREMAFYFVLIWVFHLLMRH